MQAATFAAVFIALYVAHSVGDHWVQTSHQSATKGRPGWVGRLADARHVATLTLTKLAVLIPAAALLGLHLSVPAVVAGLAVDAASHWWADRRTTLARLAALLGKGEFYRLGAPRAGRDDNPHIGTGAYALDQSFHHLWLLVAALIVATV
ncbi:transcriptional regulator [Streptomyces sp. NPDC048417]|uniref:transcriptional regulator n=1 Tax=Streptomyces sp. NPDC048417 TaxID=3155387 RepID=UPI00343FE897